MTFHEIAANGAVPCFRDLHLKPATCAPHGMNDGNCISYRSGSHDLASRLDSISESEYARGYERGPCAGRARTRLACALRVSFGTWVCTPEHADESARVATMAAEWNGAAPTRNSGHNQNLAIVTMATPLRQRLASAPM